MSPDNPGSPNEPIVGEQQDTPFTPEEQKQFDEMRGADSAPPAQPDKPAEAEKPAGSQPEEPGGEKPSKAGDKPAAGAQKPEQTAGSQPEEDEDEESAEQQPGADGQKPPPKRVSYGKFARTEAALKAEREGRAKDAQERARLDERLKIINEALTTPAAPAQQAEAEDPPPDREKDLFGYLEWSDRQLQKLNKTVAEMRQGQQATSEDQTLANNYLADARAFAQREPNFVAAYNHVFQTRALELAETLFGKDLTDPATPRLTGPEINEVRATIAREEQWLAQEAFKTGGSPAERIFRMAKLRGFRPGGAQQQPQGTSAAPAAAPAAPKGGNGAAGPGGLAAEAAAAAAPEKPSVTDEIARIKQGKDGSLSLSEAGGAPANPLTAEKLANMSQAEFERMVETLPKDKLKELMGG